MLLLLRLPWVLVPLATLAAAPVRAQGPIADPILPSGVTVEVVDFVQVPPSSASAPTARVNLLGHAGDGSGRLFVNDMRGKLWTIRYGAVLPTPFLDVVAALPGQLVTAGLQQGLSTFAFHPDYGTPGAAGEGKLYTVTHLTVGSGTPDFTTPYPNAVHHNVLSEWSVDPSDPDRIDPTSRRELLRIESPHGDHPMGQIAFDPNAPPGDPERGLLYVGMGDGGGYNGFLGQEIDPYRVGQDRTNPYGAILRIDPFGTSSPTRPTNGAYGIPDGNPYADDETGLVQEIFAYGLRNPHRFSWDTGGDGALLASDIGQANLEEIDRIVAGANYGWREREGTLALDPFDQTAIVPAPEPDADYTAPVAQYDHDEGRAVVGGFVYRGARIPDLQGHYVFGDIPFGRIFHVPVADLVDGSQATIRELTLVHEGQVKSLRQIAGGGRADLRFGIGEDGEIHLLTKRDGMVRALAPVPSTACSNARDDDGDGLFDLEDIGCASLADDSERGPGNPCDDGADDDGDGAADFPDDVGCRSALWPTEDPQCSNGVDEDLDGRIDWDGAGVGAPDPDCREPWQETENACGGGPGLALLLPALFVAGRRAELRRRS